MHAHFADLTPDGFHDFVTTNFGTRVPRAGAPLEQNPGNATELRPPPVLGRKHQFPFGSPAFPMFLPVLRNDH